MTDRYPDHFTVRTEVSVHRKNVEWLLCDALEGGSTYWVSQLTPESYAGCKWAHEAIARGVSFRIYLSEEDEYLTVENSDDRINEALQYLAQEHPTVFANVLNEREDALDADVFFQILCFGEVIYG